MISNIRLIAKCWNTSNHLRACTPLTIAHIQKYSEGFNRQPIKINHEEEILEHVQEAEGPHDYLDVMKPLKRKPLTVRPKRKQKEKIKKEKLIVKENDLRLKNDGKLNFTELKENDPILANLMLSVRSKKTRDKNSRIILEGFRLIADAIDAGLQPEIIVFSRIEDAMSLPLPERGIKFFKTPYRVIQTWSTLTTSPGLMGFFKMPDPESRQPPPDALPLTIICDNVRDPGNMGSILRACAAVGCKRLITIKGCVDIWDSKVLKTAAGAHFRMSISPSKMWDEVIGELIDPFASYFIADNSVLTKFPKEDESKIMHQSEEKEKAVKTHADLPEKSVQEARKDFDEEINQESDSEDDEEFDVEKIDAETNAEGNSGDPVEAEKVLEKTLENESPKITKTATQRLQEAKLLQRLTKFIPIVPYYGADYTSEETVLIVGGETEGISFEALDLVHKKLGIRVNIPMTNGVESLNTSMALGIIAFEVRRQHATKRAQETKKVQK
ncbi:rRNA methyltransferase 3, mitochondrial [Chelonus insularis]|uniref:rRNA methyltransferase 3, mitochondrial n=1 Tax=Chelonus insularis TaxID=460826 RepID=UPI00158B9C51|nr:rRNA methyltransferase 3, mitochondrial [Chelonus insularis]